MPGFFDLVFDKKFTELKCSGSPSRLSSHRHNPRVHSQPTKSGETRYNDSPSRPTCIAPKPMARNSRSPRPHSVFDVCPDVGRR